MTEQEFAQFLADHPIDPPWPKRILTGQQFMVLGLIRDGMTRNQAEAWLERIHATKH